MICSGFTPAKKYFFFFFFFFFFGGGGVYWNQPVCWSLCLSVCLSVCTSVYKLFGNFVLRTPLVWLLLYWNLVNTWTMVWCSARDSFQPSVTHGLRIIILKGVPPRWLSGECVGLMTWWLWVRSQVEASFLSGVFSPLTSAEACEKSSLWLWKEKLCKYWCEKARKQSSPTAIIWP